MRKAREGTASDNHEKTRKGLIADFMFENMMEKGFENPNSFCILVKAVSRPKYRESKVMNKEALLKAVLVIFFCETDLSTRQIFSLSNLSRNRAIDKKAKMSRALRRGKRRKVMQCKDEGEKSLPFGTAVRAGIPSTRNYGSSQNESVYLR